MKRIGFVCMALAVIGCSDDSSDAQQAPAGEPGEREKTYLAVVRGKLSTSNLDEAKAKHDAVASGGEANAKAAGDLAHDAMLGTTWLDSVENEFLGVDQWNDATRMQAFYADPQVQQGFAGLFAEPPVVEYFEAAPSWVGWGDLRSGDAHAVSWFHLALGTLKETETARSQAAHDQVAAGGKQPSLDAGNVAHVVFLGLVDKRRFVGVDIWKNGDAIEPFYSNPQFRAAFEGVTEPVYRSTDWHQW
jgi:quinol monooxygenase YgiN